MIRGRGAIRGAMQRRARGDFRGNRSGASGMFRGRDLPRLLIEWKEPDPEKCKDEAYIKNEFES